jgi:hypothetical protein
MTFLESWSGGFLAGYVFSTIAYALLVFYLLWRS